MCGRFALSANAGELEKLMPELKINVETITRYNIAPSQNIYAIINSEQTEFTELRWGLIPSWAKNETFGNRIINARSETLTQKPAFRNIIKHKRCLVPATGYYEWRKIPGEKRKQPYFIKLNDKALFTIAALWDEWIAPDGKKILSGTLITTAPTDSIAFIHNRMPLIINENNREAWLDKNTRLEEILKMLHPAQNINFEYYPVTLDVNNPAFNDIRCIQKAE